MTYDIFTTFFLFRLHFGFVFSLEHCVIIFSVSPSCFRFRSCRDILFFPSTNLALGCFLIPYFQQRKMYYTPTYSCSHFPQLTP